MPRIARKESEIQKEKEQIIKIALEIVHNDGYAGLSMRKIASRMGMTAANIYNYFSNKDELNIEMRRCGHIQLYEVMKTAYESGRTLDEKIKRLTKEYVSFGLNNPYYYELMFVLATPKYTDYIGTPMEEIAFREFKSSIRVYELVRKCVLDFVEAGGEVIGDVDTSVMILWSHLHSAINLYNNNLLANVFKNPEKMVEAMADYVIQMTFNQMKR